MTITYDDKDTHAINFARWILTHKHIHKEDNSVDFTYWIDRVPMKYTVEELYQLYLKQTQ